MCEGSLSAAAFQSLKVNRESVCRFFYARYGILRVVHRCVTAKRCYRYAGLNAKRRAFCGAELSDHVEMQMRAVVHDLIKRTRKKASFASPIKQSREIYAFDPIHAVSRDTQLAV